MISIAQVQRGLGLRGRHFALVLAVVASVFLAPATVSAQSTVNINVPAGPLTSSLRTLSRQADVSVIGSVSRMSRVQTKAVRGKMTAQAALRRMLEGTPLIARQVNNRTFRIERRPAPRRTSRHVSQRSPPASTAPLAVPIIPAPPLEKPKPIVVIGSKRTTLLDQYPGGVVSMSLDDARLEALAGGLDSVVAALPSTHGTSFGSGRDKIFVRGISDSSFNGPTQSTIGLYLGEQRLIYSASNPNLSLYDMENIEILEGPQGTLYGAGALGGVIRLSPARADPDEAEGTVWGSAVATSGGDPSYDVAGMVNVPLSSSEALRGVVYRGVAGGYIDDTARDLSNINRTTVTGGRLAFRSELSPDWTLDVSGFAQETFIRDAQYIDASLQGFAQQNRLAQPYKGRIGGANFVIDGRLGSAKLVSTTGIVRHTMDTRYNSTPDGGAGSLQAFDEKRDIELISHETRLSGDRFGALSWLIGFSALQHKDDYRQLITNINRADPPPLAEVGYDIREYSIFGEANHGLTDTVSATFGGRLTYTEGTTSRTFGSSAAVEPSTNEFRVLPLAAVSWQLSDDISSYLRYQQGFRSAGVAVERADNGDPQIARFDSDKVQSVELGIKGLLPTDAPIQFSVASFFTKWRDVQGDIIDQNGFVVTRNIGDAEIFGLTMSSDAELSPNLNLTSAFFLNRTKLERIDRRSGLFSAELPNIPAYSAQIGLRYRRSLAPDTELILRTDVQYTGQSVLDISAQEQDGQGDFVKADVNIALVKPVWELALSVENLTDSAGNRFSFGNPFSIRTEQQEVPLRPLSVRISGKVKF